MPFRGVAQEPNRRSLSVEKKMTGAPDDLVLVSLQLLLSSFQDASKLYSFSHVSP